MMSRLSHLQHGSLALRTPIEHAAVAHAPRRRHAGQELRTRFIGRSATLRRRGEQPPLPPDPGGGGRAAHPGPLAADGVPASEAVAAANGHRHAGRVGPAALQRQQRAPLVALLLVWRRGRRLLERATPGLDLSDAAARARCAARATAPSTSRRFHDIVRRGHAGWDVHVPATPVPPPGFLSGYASDGVAARHSDADLATARLPPS